MHRELFTGSGLGWKYTSQCSRPPCGPGESRVPSPALAAGGRSSSQEGERRVAWQSCHLSLLPGLAQTIVGGQRGRAQPRPPSQGGFWSGAVSAGCVSGFNSSLYKIRFLYFGP